MKKKKTNKKNKKVMLRAGVDGTVVVRSTFRSIVVD